ncbi:MAG: Na+/H+ antiporter NhaC family protein [Kangiellaceae bacterium]|jgi:Na+:H+ antiporter, NhaC family
MSSDKRDPSLVDALIPILSLIVMLATSVVFYGSDSSYGANQIALILGAAIATLIGFKNGYSWKEIETGISKGIATAYGAIMILMMVGALIGTWIVSGTVPTMIYFGLQILDPSIFYVAACLICAMVSISIGSSWTTAGTVGVALIGIAAGLEMSLAITAGAIISGAYFGDKMSPLSDTTNLAPAVAGTDLFSHIRHMAWTTGPSIILAMTLFAIIGFAQDSNEQPANLGSTVAVLQDQFNITGWALLPLLLVLFLAFKKVPAFLTLLIGALVGGVFAVVLQPETLDRTVESSKYSCSANSELIEACEISSVSFDEQVANINLSVTLADGSNLEQSVVSKLTSGSTALAIDISGSEETVEFSTRYQITNSLDAVWRALFAGYQSNSGDEAVDDLLSRGGMSSMLNTIWLILTALTFGAVLETVGLLKKVVESILSMVKGTGSLVASVIGTCVTTNIIAADQYIAIVLPGRMFKAEFKRRGLDAKNLSRTLEDSATMTSPLIPWNTCGVYMAGVLGVPTLVYLPFCFFNIASPFISIAYGIMNFKITRIDSAEAV